MRKCRISRVMIAAAVAAAAVVKVRAAGVTIAVNLIDIVKEFHIVDIFN